MPESNKSKSSAIKAARERIRLNMSQFGDIEALAREIVNGKVEALARAITLIESNKDEDRPLAHELLKQVRNNSKKIESTRYGVTGIPGVGKSTFIEKLGLEFIENGDKVAVLAVDPSSQKTGGSILGDKTRMEKLSVSDNAFIRPSPASDTLGGVARATMEAILLCEAAGYNKIIVETVGVGQSETSVREMVDVFCLLLIGGAGDEVQGIKRGIVEMADIIIVHKADGESISLCNDTASAYKSSLHLLPNPKGGNIVEIITASSITGDGHDEFKQKVESLVTFWKENGHFDMQRTSQRIDRMKTHVRDLIMFNSLASNKSKEYWDELTEGVENGELSAFTAAWSWVHESNK
tara:strand:- start:95 stop:1150 length:1056 start_codon:yes stop_codon:yes gene_type:complete